MKIVEYGGWKQCARLTDGRIELIATLEVGPRIIRFGFDGGPNEFVEFAEDMGKTGGSEYRSYGGHRLWVSPEVAGRTDLPDNSPVRHEWDGENLTLTAPVEQATHLQREMQITLTDGGVRIEHRVYNKGMFEVYCAPWCLSVMAPGGQAFFPQEAYRPHSEQLLPARPMVLWAYTDMSDPRWTWGRRLIRLRQDATATTPQKVGALVTAGWAAYRNGDHVFVKCFPCEAEEYPDFGCNFETYTNERMLELESLGPMQVILPGERATHVETWGLFEAVSLPDEDAPLEDELARLASEVPEPE